jgi:hypothetical protein
MKSKSFKVIWDGFNVKDIFVLLSVFPGLEENRWRKVYFNFIYLWIYPLKTTYNFIFALKNPHIILAKTLGRYAVSGL